MEEIRVAELFQPISPTVAIDVEKQAEDDAYHQKPESNATSLGATERSVVHHFTDLLNQERVRAVALLTQLETTRDQLSIDGIVQEANNIPAQTETSVNTELLAAHDELVRIQIDEQQAYSAKQIFMRENGLNRPAHYPESRVFSFAILAVIILLESMGNAYFFATGSELGYLGGIIQAILVSLANVVMIAGIGGYWAARYARHVSICLRTAGFIGLSVALFLICAFNLLVAHYRVALQQTPDTAISEATYRFVEHPFALTNFDAWILFILGIGAAFIAGYKWFTWDDIYPGYGNVDRIHKQAQDNYSTAQRQIHERIASLIEHANKKLADYITKFEQVVQQYQTLLQRSKMVLEQYPSYVNHVQDVCNQFINRYRSVNRLVRATPAPAYFQEPVTLQDPIGLPVKNWKTEEQKLKQLQTSRESFLTTTRQEVGNGLRIIRTDADQKLQAYFSRILEEAKQRTKQQPEAGK